VFQELIRLRGESRLNFHVDATNLVSNDDDPEDDDEDDDDDDVIPASICRVVMSE
jgi:hypothetical protein